MVFDGQIIFSTPQFVFSAPQIPGARKMKTPPSPHICSNIEGGGVGEGGGADPKKKKKRPPPTKNGLKIKSA